MWKSSVHRLALLELLTRGLLTRRSAQRDAFEALSELPWTQRTGRRDELRLVDNRRDDLVFLIERVWPEWRTELAELIAVGYPPTPDGWKRLEDRRRAANLPALPPQVNRRTAASLVAPHSKAALTVARRAVLGSTETHHDGAVRLRPPVGLVARSEMGVVDLSAVAAVLGEVSVPDRALRGGLQLEGSVQAILLVENLGAFCDVAAPRGWLVVHVPGWDTPTARQLLGCLPDVPAVHFGDLDENGVRIYHHLRAVRPDLRWFIPAFWEELVEARALPGEWADDLDVSDAPPFVRELVSRGLWLEQEPVAVDPRIPAALAELLGS